MHRRYYSLLEFVAVCGFLGGLAMFGQLSEAVAQEKKAAPEATPSPSIQHQEKIASLPFLENRATAESAQTLRDELLYHRATQTYLWALPLINTLGMQVGSEKAFGEGYNILPVWKKRLDTKTIVTTPNSDVIYAMSYVDLGKDGPLVFEAPPNLQGILLDFWQTPIPVDGGKFAGDVGFFGPDASKGGKFLLLPPGYTGDVPEGHFVYRSGTNNVFVFLRAFYSDPGNLKPPVDLIEQVKIHPLTGLIQLMAGWQAESWHDKLARLIHGGIATVGGIAVLAHPFYGLAAMSLVLAIFFAAEGIWKIVSSFSYRPVPGWIALLFSGVLDLILGILIWRQWPVSGLWAVGILVGVNLLSTGIAFVALAITWKSTVHAVKSKIEIV
jgi:uncharacterized membrane protein HdeD (DUF308 family)